MLDEEHAEAVFRGEPPQIGFECRGFAWVEACRRFVEAQEARVEAHGPGDLEPALRAVGQRAGEIVGPRGQPHALQPDHRLVDRRFLGHTEGRQSEQALDLKQTASAHRPVLRHQQIFEAVSPANSRMF